MKTNIDNTFIRFGKMHLTKQQGYGSDTFHAPPAPIGFYAMPIRFQEYFLIGSLDKTQPKYLPLPKIKDDENVDWNERSLLQKKRFKKLIHKFVVDNEEYVWHHLSIAQNLIIDRHNSWVKTTVRDWKNALIKESIKLRVESMATDFDVKKSSGGKRLAEVRPKTGCYSKDHFEVFFDSKVY
jgi:hypothetical protein